MRCSETDVLLDLPTNIILSGKKAQLREMRDSFIVALIFQFVITPSIFVLLFSDIRKEGFNIWNLAMVSLIVTSILAIKFTSEVSTKKLKYLLPLAINYIYTACLIVVKLVLNFLQEDRPGYFLLVVYSFVWLIFFSISVYFSIKIFKFYFKLADINENEEFSPYRDELNSEVADAIRN